MTIPAWGQRRQDWRDGLPPTPPAGESDAGETWRPIKLADAIAGIGGEEPTMWGRSDGKRSIYPGRVHWFQGEPESLKSMAAQSIAVETMNAGANVLYLDFEDDEHGVTARLLSMGMDAAAIEQRLTYIRPGEQLSDPKGKVTAAAIALGEVLEDRSYELCIIDGVTEGMTVEGLGIMDNTDIAAWLRLLPKRISNLGTAVICIDHVTKSSEGRGRYAIGGQHKLAGVTGAALLFTTERPLSRALGVDPVEAAIAVTVMKDRPGYVRGNATDGKVGTFEVTAYPDGGLSAAFAAPNETTQRMDMVIAERVLEYLHDYDGSSLTAVKVGVEGNNDNVVSTLRMMVARGWLRIEKKGQAHNHWLTDLGRKVAEGGEDA